MEGVQSNIMAIDREIPRKLFHLGAGVMLAFLVGFGLVNAWHLAAVVLAGFIVSLAMRKKRLPVIGWFLGRMERQDAMATFPGRGAFFFFCGMLISVAIFPRDVASASIIVLAIGDSVPLLVSRRFGGPRVMGRPITGGLVGLCGAFLGAALFLPVQEALVASLAGMAIETVDTVRGRRIEDNVTMPLAAGVAVMLLRIFFLPQVPIAASRMFVST
jgi:dolichol kinase